MLKSEKEQQLSNEIVVCNGIITTRGTLKILKQHFFTQCGPTRLATEKEIQQYINRGS